MHMLLIQGRERAIGIPEGYPDGALATMAMSHPVARSHIASMTWVLKAHNFSTPACKDGLCQVETTCKKVHEVLASVTGLKG